MGRREPDSLRALPRLFVPGFDPEEGAQELPKEELDKLRKVLRLETGAIIAVLPNNGTVVRCRLEGRQAVPLAVETAATEPALRLTLAQALPKGDKLDEVIRMGTELGVAKFVLFPSERTVVRWDERKLDDRLRRLHTIAREAAEVAFRMRLPEFGVASGLKEVLAQNPDAWVMSETEGVPRTVAALPREGAVTVVIGPEGGWAPRELGLIGDRGVTLGPRVLRVDTAGAATAALLLCDR